jgi:gliding motility-associated lipoprotein GldH
MSKLKYILPLFLALIISSCDQNCAYERYDTIENEKWDLTKTFTHEFDITDSMQWYNMYINIRNTTDFRNSNLFLFVTTTFPKGQMAKDTLECVLADPKGKWYGKGNDRFKDCKIIFKPKFRFSQTGKYKINIQHAMREQVVVGISDIGIRLEKIK